MKMNMQDWINNTPLQEIEECLDATDGTMGELIGEYKKIKAMNNSNMYENVSIANAFESMLEAAKDYHEEVAADNETCPHCQDNGMNCYHCNGTGKRPTTAENT